MAPRPRPITCTFDPAEARAVNQEYAACATGEIVLSLLVNHQIRLPPDAQATITSEIEHALSVQLASILEHRTKR